MRILICMFILCFMRTTYCSLIPSAQIITQTPSALTTSHRIGGNFAYSTIESRALPSVVHTPVSYVTQPVHYQSIFGSPFFNPIISSPFYPGIVGQAPGIGQTPIFGGQGPIIGFPGQGQIPIQAPVAGPPQGVPQGPAPPPPGAVVDDDTVSVEAP